MSLKKTKDGCWRYRYFSNGSKTGKYIQKTLPKGTTHAEAKELYRADIAEASARRGSMARTITFEKLAAEYIATHGPKMAENSLERAEDIITLHLLPTFGHMVVSAIKTIHVTNWQSGRRAKADASTVNREWNTFRAILNFGEAHEIIERNPIRRNVVKPLAVAKRNRDEFFEPDEWRRFLAVFDDAEAWKEYLTRRSSKAVARFTTDGHPTGKGTRRPDSAATLAYIERLRAIVPILRTTLYTAARIGEVLTLTWGAVDFRRGTIAIVQHKTKRKVPAPKTLPICAPLRALLQSLPVGVGDALIFRKPNGSAYTYMEVNRALERARELSHVNPTLTLHSIRHTVGSWLTIAGHPERHISQVLGHAQVSVTSRYSHLRDRSLAPVLADLCRIEAEGFRPDEEMTDVNAFMARQG